MSEGATKCAEVLSAQLCCSQEELIARAIANEIGDGWSLQSIASRITRKSYPYPSTVDVIALDGKNILELYPVRLEHVTEDGVFKIKAVQNYHMLNQGAAK